MEVEGGWVLVWDDMYFGVGVRGGSRRGFFYYYFGDLFGGFVFFIFVILGFVGL